MPQCDQCSEQKDKLQVCSRCKSARWETHANMSQYMLEHASSAHHLIVSRSCHWNEQVIGWYRCRLASLWWAHHISSHACHMILVLNFRYCSSSCQRAAWKAHKKSCQPPSTPAGPSVVARSTTSSAPRSLGSSADPPSVPAVLLGCGCTADKVLIPKPPFQIADVRHLFTLHPSSKDLDFITMPMPFGLRLFNREMHIIFDRSMLPGSPAAPFGLTYNNTFATRGAASLSTGFGPPIRNQALVFDPSGAAYHMCDFLAYDDVVYNTIMDEYSENWTARTPTEAELDKLKRVCSRRYQQDRPNYTDDGRAVGYGSF